MATCACSKLLGEPVRRFLSKLVVCASLAVVGGCAPLASQPSVINVAWVSQDKIYLLREIGSDSVELWLREAGRERKLASNADVLDHCGPLDFLFAVKPGQLVLAMACDGFTRLVLFSEATGAFAALLDLPTAASVALADDGRAGYIGTGKDGCWAIQPFGKALRSYFTDWEEYSCHLGKSAKSPALVGENSVVFLATNELPPEQPVRDERRGWRLMITSQAGEVSNRWGRKCMDFLIWRWYPEKAKWSSQPLSTARGRSLRLIFEVASLGGYIGQKVLRFRRASRRMANG